MKRFAAIAATFMLSMTTTTELSAEQCTNVDEHGNPCISQGPKVQYELGVKQGFQNICDRSITLHIQLDNEEQLHFTYRGSNNVFDNCYKAAGCHDIVGYYEECSPLPHESTRQSPKAASPSGGSGAEKEQDVKKDAWDRIKKDTEELQPTPPNIQELQRMEDQASKNAEGADEKNAEQQGKLNDKANKTLSERQTEFNEIEKNKAEAEAKARDDLEEKEWQVQQEQEQEARQAEIEAQQQQRGAGFSNETGIYAPSLFPQVPFNPVPVPDFRRPQFRYVLRPPAPTVRYAPRPQQVPVQNAPMPTGHAQFGLPAPQGNRGGCGGPAAPRAGGTPGCN
jgi:hypothetical protein